MASPDSGYLTTIKSIKPIFSPHFAPMNRREFSRMLGLGVSGLVCSRYSFAQPSQSPSPANYKRSLLPSQVLTTDLGGDTWTFRQDGTSEAMPAHVPGDHYTDLFRASKIPAPNYRNNNDSVQWAAERSWIYERTFDVPAEQLARKYIELVCEGLDTFATVMLNGVTVASTNNMFRTWVIDVKIALKAGSNQLRIKFDPLPDITAQSMAYEKKYEIPNWVGVGEPGGKYKPQSWIRKGPYQWGWDWCRPILTMGVWKKIELRAYDLRLADVGVKQHHNPDGTVQLDLKMELAGVPTTDAHVRAHLLGPDGMEWNAAPVKDSVAALSLAVIKPKLWWPNGMGDPNLYTIEIQIVDGTGNILDTVQKRVGLRRFEVIPAQNGESLQLRVNGEPFFAKGANWIPADNMVGRATPEVMRWYMQDAAACNFNFVRLWGGGLYEDDLLFDACDELGLAVLFEFKFGTYTYPIFDADFAANVAAEVDDQLRRIRHHPCIAMWSGNNEADQFKGYTELFDTLIGGKVRNLVQDACYEMGSGAFRSQDLHLWSVWHGGKPFRDYDNSHGFVAEFGMQSYLEPASTRQFTNESDRATGIESPIFAYHEKSGQKTILQYLQKNFGTLPPDLGDVLWLSQIMQAYGIRQGIEHWRRDRPKSMAAVIWQFNDSWPGETWSMIDYYHRWKALQYHARHMYAPLLVSGQADASRGMVDVYVVNDRLTGGKADLTWRLTNTNGKVLRKGKTTFDLPVNGSHLVETITLNDAEKAGGLKNLLVWLAVHLASGMVSRNVAFFVLPGQLALPVTSLQTKVKGSGKKFAVTLASPKPALWAWINLETEPDARYSDNFVHLEPGKPVTITVDCPRELRVEEFQRQLKARSVKDLVPNVWVTRLDHYQVNCGGQDVDPFKADDYFMGGNGGGPDRDVTIDTSAPNAAPAQVYKSARWGNSVYKFEVKTPAPDHSCTVRLHFCETTFDAPGQRKFAVEINGNEILNEFDPYQEAGAKNKAVVKDCIGIQPNSDGNIVLKFKQGSADEAEVDGIEILNAVS
jgi:beta-mannosidase